MAALFFICLKKEWISLTTGLVLSCLINVCTLTAREIALLAVKIEAAWDLALDRVVGGAAESSRVHIFRLNSWYVALVTRDML